MKQNKNPDAPVLILQSRRVRGVICIAVGHNSSIWRKSDSRMCSTLLVE